MQLSPSFIWKKEGEGEISVSGKIRCGQRHDTKPGPVKYIKPPKPKKD